jgi:hypothetical protein
MVLILAGATALAAGSRTKPWRVIGVVTLVFYALFAAFAAAVWGALPSA